MSLPLRYKFDNISALGAATLLAALAGNPSTLFLTQGPLGKVTFFILKWFSLRFVNEGVIFINVGADYIKTFSDENSFDGSWENAQALIQKMRESGKGMTDEEAKKIDQPVVDAFRKFGRFGKLRNG